MEVECSGVWIGDVLADENLRLEAGTFGSGAEDAARAVEGGKFPAVRFEEFAVSYTLGRSVRVIASKSPYPFYQPSSVTDIKPEYDGYLYSPQTEQIEALRMREGQVLLTCSGTIGRTVYVSRTLGGKLLSQDMIRIDCKNPEDAGYIYTYLKSPACQKILQSLAYGAVIQHINPEHLNDIPVPDAPAELRRKIHELVVKSYALRDKSNDMLDEAEALMISALNLPPLREIKKECEAEEGHIQRFEVMSYEFNGRFDASYHSPLVCAVMKYLEAGASEVLTVGDKRVSSQVLLPGRFKRVYVNEGYGAVFIGGKQIGELDPADKKYLAFSQHEKRIQELTIHKDTILITCSGTIGRVAIVPEHWDGWTASQHIIRVIPASRDVAGCLYVWLASEWGRALVERYSYGAVIQEVNDEHIGSVAFPVIGDASVRERVNGLALDANELRAEAWRVEREAVRLLEEEVSPS